MRNEPYRDGLYLDELKDHDIDNLKSLFLKMPVRRFKSREEVRRFIQAVIENSLRKCGVREWGDTEDLERALTQAGVRIERRLAYEKPDEWRKGTYIYKNGEIVTFISEPRKVIEKKTGSGVVVIGDGPEWLIKTNGEGE